MILTETAELFLGREYQQVEKYLSGISDQVTLEKLFATVIQGVERFSECLGQLEKGGELIASLAEVGAVHPHQHLLNQSTRA